ncbi:MAG: uroporphyrinogen decarboxylase family protein [Candidatus Pacebacteria bacterium]|nr:uroporphyrinogen decarboxylase family protein [Candidatus Paceibacterota bacterium]
MPGSRERINAAFSHRTPDRTPLFEIFQPYHPIHWPVCGRTVGTDAAMCWDAMAEGIAWEELVEAHAQAAFQIARFFGLDMVRLNGAPAKHYSRPVKTGATSWKRDGKDYVLNPRTQLVVLANPGDLDADSHKQDEDKVRGEVEAWDGTVPDVSTTPDPVYARVRELGEAEGLDWVYMAEIGAGTGAAFYPPFLLMWMLAEPELYMRWLDMKKKPVFASTAKAVKQGYDVIAMGGDVSCDKGPFISPDLYHTYILPVIQEHVRVIHDAGAKAVYTSDGNHWPIKDDFFFNSGVDGYKEVDYAAGMTMERLIEEGIDRRLCIIGNIDARHTLCHAAPEDVEEHVINCLKLGRKSPGGHILHASHSVHEDVKAENYVAAVNAYRSFFGMERLPYNPSDLASRI